ncbi:Chitobiase [Balamuthia mandrillaris]
MEEGKQQQCVLLLLVLLFSLCCGTCALAAEECPCSDPSLCKPITAPPRKEIFVFSTSKEDNWKQYDWSQITTIAMFSGAWHPELLCHAHSVGARVVLSTSFPVANLSNAQQRHEWIEKQIERVASKNADGINFDMEAQIPASAVEERKMQVVLVQETVAAFHSRIPGSQVSFDVAWSPDCVDNRCYDYLGLSQALDFLVVMAYDLQSQIFEPQPCIAGPNSGYYSVEHGIDRFVQLGVDKSKLVLALPWYGRDYRCVHPTNMTVCPNEPVPFRGAYCSDANAKGRFFDWIEKLYASGGSLNGRQWDERSLSPYTNYFNATQGQMHQIWYDDPASLTLKVKLAKAKFLRGVGIWNADLIDYTNRTQIEVMWNTAKAF